MKCSTFLQSGGTTCALSLLVSRSAFGGAMKLTHLNPNSLPIRPIPLGNLCLFNSFLVFCQKLSFVFAEHFS